MLAEQRARGIVAVAQRNRPAQRGNHAYLVAMAREGAREVQMIERSIAALFDGPADQSDGGLAVTALAA